MNKVIHTPLILASQSQSRAQILSQVGIDFTAVPSGVNEDLLKKQSVNKGWDIDRTALELAKAKAYAVSRLYPDAFVIGADQIMGCDGIAFDKAKSIDEARDQLSFMSAKSHYLYTACVLYHHGKEIWSTLSIPKLTVRPLSHRFIEDYLKNLGEEVLRSVGCYQVEGRGAQLFDVIEGDIFTIMGLPLIPLLQELRRLQVILS